MLTLGLTLGLALSGCDGDPSPTPPAGEEAGAPSGTQAPPGGAGAVARCASAAPSGEPEELCDGVDDDCDGVIDEGLSLGEPCERQLLSCSSQGVFVCVEGVARCDAAEISPREETCDALDNDCDGLTDEGFNTQIDSLNCGACGVECRWARGLGRCEAGACLLTGCEVGWADQNGDPADGCECNALGEELCDGLDNDCDERVDESYPVGEPCVSGVGACAASGAWACVSEREAECDARPSPPSGELCDGLDNDCDGVSDEDFDADLDGAPACDECLTCGGDCPALCAWNDCDDMSSSVYPTAFDRCEDGVDQNCDGRDAPCTESYARATTMRLIATTEAPLSCPDLTGDGVGDNAFGVVSGVANAAMANYISIHEMNVLLSAQGFDLLDPSVRFNLSVLLGRWVNNTNRYTVSAAQYEETGEPRMRFPFSALGGERADGGTLEGGPGRFTFSAPINGAIVEVPVEGAYIRGQVTFYSPSVGGAGTFQLRQALVSGHISKDALAQSLVLIDPPIARAIEMLLQADVDSNADGVVDAYSLCLAVEMDGVTVTRE